MSVKRLSNKIDFFHPDFPGVIVQYGISPEEFTEIVTRLQKKFNFLIEPSLFDAKKPLGKIHIPQSYVSFVYYCNALDGGGIDVGNLVRQFTAAKKARSFTDIRHVSSLACLGFILYRRGNNVVFPKIESGDIIVNGIRAELKVVLSDFLKETDGRDPEGLIIKDGRVAIGESIEKRVNKFLRNRLPEAMQQGDIVFIDCSDVPLFNVLALHSKPNGDIPDLVKGRVVLYGTQHYMPNVQISRNEPGGEKISFIPTAPDLDYFFGTHIDME